MDLNFNAHMNMELNGRVYSFIMPIGAPYIDCREVALAIIKNINEMEKKFLEEAKAQENSSSETN